MTFAQTVRVNRTLSSLDIAAWLPAKSITRPGWSGHGTAEQIVRIALGSSRIEWPTPAAWSGWFPGAWASGPVTLPDGAELGAGPAWRRR